MRWIELALFCAVLWTTCAEPEPKKYKPEIKTKQKQSNTSLTDEERKFLREVEAKFGIKSDIPEEGTIDADDDEEEDLKPSEEAPIKSLFPAVIAIEIVNDTDITSKGKRTIDANLGYGYRTNNGYAYTYLGKPAQEKGKFMIYPYSQEDIPPAQPTSSNSGYSQHTGQKYTKNSVNVEITPSQAYELVPSKEEQTSYQYEKPAIDFKTKYENIQSVESPPPPYPAGEPPTQRTPSTLYTTYNGHQFSGLSGQFPSVMSNYLVDPTHLLKNPQYQSAGLTQDHLRSHGGQLEQRVVPVLVLRIPSSYLKEPKAELYANLPQNYPLSQYLNNVNLQELVNQYFKKIGYQYAPQVMAYQSPQPVADESTLSTPVSNHVPQQYASPYVQPTYTHVDYSGVQYSGVQPVMAKYPSGYLRQQYFVTRGQSLYRQPLHQQYVYRYSYVPQTAVQPQSYYVQPQYQQQTYQVAAQEGQNEQATVDQHATVQETSDHSEYGAHQQVSQDENEGTNVQYTITHTQPPEYGQAHSASPHYETVETATAQYEMPKEASSVDHGPTKVPVSVYGPQASQVHYQQPLQKETVAVFPRSQAGHRYSIAQTQAEAQQTYVYQNHVHGDSAGDTLTLTENYPSKDHTIATVLPVSYKSRLQHPEPVQAVSYVTPIPHVMKYHSHYRVMVPQTVLRSPIPTSEKVSYVNSHSLPVPHSHLGSANSREVEYTVGPHYIPPIGKQRPPLHPRNYHAHPKRMTRQERKTDTTVSKKQFERGDKRKPS